MRLLTILLVAVYAAIPPVQAHPQPHFAERAQSAERDIDLANFAQSIQSAMEQRGSWDYMKRDASFEGFSPRRDSLTLEELVVRTEQAGLVERAPPTLMPADQALSYLVALDPDTGAEYHGFDLASGDQTGSAGENQWNGDGTSNGPAPASASVNTPPQTTNFALSSLPSTIIPPYYSPGGKGGALNEDSAATTSGAATRGLKAPIGSSPSGVGAAITFGLVGGLFLTML